MIKIKNEILSEKNNLRSKAQKKLNVIDNGPDKKKEKVINESEKFQEKFDSQNALLSSVINSVTDIIIFSLDRNYCYTAFNQRHYEEMKKIWNVDIKLGMNLLECMYKEDLKLLAKKSMDKVLNGESVNEIQHQPEPDIYYEFNWNPIYQNNKVIGITAFIRDITKQKHNEIQLKKLNRIYSVLNNINQVIVRAHDPLEMMKEVCYIAVEYGKFEMAYIGLVNNKADKVDIVASYGDLGDYLDKVNIDLIDSVRSREPTGAAIKTGNHAISNNIMYDDNMLPWREKALKCGYKSCASFPLIVKGKVFGAFNLYADKIDFFQDDDIKLLDELAIDISFAIDAIENESERKRVQNELQQSNELLRAIIKAAPTAIFDLDLEGYVKSVWNPAAEKLLGWSADEAIGHFLPSVPEKGKEEFKSFREKIQRGEILDGVEVRRQKKDSTPIDYCIYASPMQNASGEIIGNVAVLVDITERKRNDAINNSRMYLMQFAATHTLDELLEETLNEAEKLSDSKIGFYHFVEDDQVSLTSQNLSRRAKAEFCKIEKKGLHYPIKDAGVWVDCINKRKPIVNNDYASLPYRKGMPEGHAEVIRELVVPVIRGDKIKAILGVGNKPTDYDEKDVEIISLLADLAWEIIERKKNEEMLLRSEQRLRLHTEQSPLGFLEWDENFCAIEWNNACEQIFGYKREEAIGRHAKDLILPVQVHELVDGIYINLMNQTGGQHSINENVTKDGRTIICEWFNTTLINKDGKAIGVASVCNDITEQKQMEAELVKYREHLEELVKARTAELEVARNKAQQYLDIAGVIIIVINTERRITLINQKGCEVLGYNYKEIIGKDWFNMFVPENIHKNVIKYFNQLIAGKVEHVKYYENPVLTKNGEKRLIAWHNVLLHDDKGKIIGTLSSGEDITDQKQAEIQIIKLNRELKDRALALEAANMELESFSYSVSHDLRAPLRGIDGFSQVLLEEYKNKLDESGRNYLNRVRNAAQHMAQLIDDMLKLSKVSRGDINIYSINLSKIAHEIANELSENNPERKVKFIIQDDITANADERLLRIVLQNLIGNAWKFTSKLTNAVIEFSTLQQNEESVYFVRDDGAGFDMQYTQKLFGAFQRLHSTNEFPGTGIGLATVKRIIHRHGGRIWAESEIDKGTTLYFTLP